MAETVAYFCTNRPLIRRRAGPEFADAIVGDADSIRFGRVAAKGARIYARDLDALAAEVSVEVAPERLDPADATRSLLGSAAVFAEVRAQMLAGADALVFVHGYNHTFRQAAGRALQVAQWLGEKRDRPLLMLFFTWPSRGAGVRPATYRDDRILAQASGPALGRAILKATDFIRNTAAEARCDGRIHLMAHSMGNWALRAGVQAMRTFVGDNIPPLFDEVLLIAADEDDDALEAHHKLAPILRGCRRLTVYFNQQDLALKASDVAMGNPDRLGRAGPRGLLPAKVVRVNVAPVVRMNAPDGEGWQADPQGHQYHRNNATVRADLLAVMAAVEDRDIPGRTDRDGVWRLG